MPYRLLYAGTPQFAVPALSALLAHPDYQVMAVCTQPDRPSGRGRQLTPSPVKQCAEAAGVPILQPEKLAPEHLTPFLPIDALIVAAFGQILSSTVLELPRYGSLNLHASCLPRWRGAAPIARAILAGDTVTGISVMQMVEALDAGPVWRQDCIPILPTDTAQTLHDRLAALAAESLLKALPVVFSGSTIPLAQPLEGVTYAKKLKKQEARIDWQQSSAQIDRHVRAFFPYPVAETRFRNQTLRIFQGTPAFSPLSSPQAPGTILAVERTGWSIACGEGTFGIERVQLAGGKILSAWDAAQGLGRHHLLGAVLGG